METKDVSKPEAGQWPSRDVVSKLIEAAEILLHRMDYDGDGYEEISHCVDLAKKHLQPQPAEDPDEWVPQDRVPRRVKIDQFVYLSPLEMSRGFPEDVWRFFRGSSDLPAGEIASDGRKNGFTTVSGTTLQVRCRRRDLPQPQPQKTRVRLWVTLDGIVWMDNDALIPECWKELHHDSDGFYVEDQT